MAGALVTHQRWRDEQGDTDGGSSALVQAPCRPKLAKLPQCRHNHPRCAVPLPQIKQDGRLRPS